MSGWAWVHGRVLPSGEANVSVLDRGLLLGEGVYETCLVLDGRPFALTRHLHRLRRSAAIIGLDVPWTDGDLREACSSVLHGGVSGGAPGRSGQEAPVDDVASDECTADHTGPVNDPVTSPAPSTPLDAVTTPRRSRLRITVTGGSGPLGPDQGSGAPTLLVTAGPTAPWAATATVVISRWPIEHRRPSVGAKTTSRLDLGMALTDAQRLGADEAVLVNSAGVLCEGTGSNLFLVLDGALHTPDLVTGCLAGVTRELIAELMPVTERNDLTVEDLLRAPEAFLTSSTRDVHPISFVDGRPVERVAGPMTHEAATALRRLQASTIDP